MRNLESKVPEDRWAEFKAWAAACYQAASPALARLLRDEIVAAYGEAMAVNSNLHMKRKSLRSVGNAKRAK
jgi:hypothetical protein